MIRTTIRIWAGIVVLAIASTALAEEPGKKGADIVPKGLTVPPTGRAQEGITLKGVVYKGKTMIPNVGIAFHTCAGVSDGGQRNREVEEQISARISQARTTIDAINSRVRDEKNAISSSLRKAGPDEILAKNREIEAKYKAELDAAQAAMDAAQKQMQAMKESAAAQMRATKYVEEIKTMKVKFDELYRYYKTAKDSKDRAEDEKARRKKEIRQNKQYSSADIQRENKEIEQYYKPQFESIKKSMKEEQDKFDAALQLVVRDLDAQAAKIAEDKGWIRTTTDKGGRYTVNLPTPGRYYVLVTSGMTSGEGTLYIFYDVDILPGATDLIIQDKQYVFE